MFVEFVVFENWPICRDLEILYDDVYWSHGMYTWRCIILYPLRLLRIIYMHANFLLFVDDVTSISWINALFACFIALIEIGRYTQAKSRREGICR